MSLGKRLYAQGGPTRSTRKAGRKNKSAVSIELEGAEDLTRRMQRLQDTHPRGARIVAGSLRAGSTYLGREIRKAAPKGKTKLIRKAVASRVKRRRGKLTAKVGLNVGRKRNTAPHAHLVTLGTEERTTADGRSRGAIKPGNAFVRLTANRHRREAVDRMRQRFNQQLEKELRKT